MRNKKGHPLFSPPEGNLPFSGIATFAGYGLWQPDEKADAVVLGVPYDEGTTYRPGARFGPRSVRNASMFYSYEGQDDRFFDADRREWILSGKVIADAGDVAIEPLCLDENRHAITQSVQSILKGGAIPAVIGGDHSITAPVMEAFRDRPLHYIHFDSHADCDRIFTSKFTHGSPTALILEKRLARSITLIGIRGLTNSGHDVSWIEQQGATIITARDLRGLLQTSAPGPFPEGDCYISLDIDFFDPAAAPGTGTPEPGGLFFPEFSDLIHRIAGSGKIVGFDVVEVNPLVDNRSEVTAHLAARCMLELMTAALDPKQ